MQYQSVYDLIRRALPGKESYFAPGDESRRSSNRAKIVTASVAGGKIILSGDCVISLCMAFTPICGRVRRQSILVQ